MANKQGLCIESKQRVEFFCSVDKIFMKLLLVLGKGKISPNAAGLLVAILEQAGRLEPNSNPPVVALESGKKYIVQKVKILFTDF